MRKFLTHLSHIQYTLQYPRASNSAHIILRLCCEYLISNNHKIPIFILASIESSGIVKERCLCDDTSTQTHAYTYTQIRATQFTRFAIHRIIAAITGGVDVTFEPENPISMREEMKCTHQLKQRLTWKIELAAFASSNGRYSLISMNCSRTFTKTHSKHWFLVYDYRQMSSKSESF